MPLPDDTYRQVRARLLAHPVPAYEGEAPTPAAAVRELARLNGEAADLLAQSIADAHDIAATHRRQAAVLVHLAAEDPAYEPDARRAVEVWQAGEDRAMSRPSRGTSGGSR